MINQLSRLRKYRLLSSLTCNYICVYKSVEVGIGADSV